MTLNRSPTCLQVIDSMVGAGRFERPTPCAQGRCATRLRYAPTSAGLFILNHFPAFSKLAIGYFLFPFGQAVPKLCQNRSVWSDCANTLVLLVGLPIELQQGLPLHLQLHLRILLEDLGVTLTKH